ncbi:MAG TPA: hypothetical protein VKR83_13760 [Ktedonobacteraceae bacterium]|nr:hypothetical protein [Ktedonobacteraceae bacterium]
MSNDGKQRARGSSHISSHDEKHISMANTERLDGRSRKITGIIGAVLIIGAACWLGWLLLRQFTGIAGISISPLSATGATLSPTVALTPLAAAGISLGHPTLTPALNQQQALLLAGELEPVAAAQAKKTSSEYVSLTYADRSNARSDLTNIPAWLIIYRQIPIPANDPSVDPASSQQTHQDLYVFLDANNGKELLAIMI